jgi:hypothetical protein
MFSHQLSIRRSPDLLSFLSNLQQMDLQLLSAASLLLIL